jgi:lipoprotein-releasing system permease protein
MLGVLVLVVVMAVYAGMERDVKGRLLGFTPHILLRQQIGGAPLETMVGWEQAAALATKLPHVEAATPFVADFVFLKMGNRPRPVNFRGIDTSDPTQVAGIESLLDKAGHPNSSADLGIDDRVVVSSLVAEQFGMQVGDTVRLFSASNLEHALPALELMDQPPLREAHAEVWQAATGALAKAWQEEDGKFAVPVELLQQKVYGPLEGLVAEEIREPELKLVTELLLALEQNEKDETAEVYRFTPEAKAAVEACIAAINTTDRDKLDGMVTRSIKKFVLPREVTVWGIYQASQMAMTPDVFMPLPLAQDLAGLEDAVQGVALRLDDPYLAEQVAAAARESMGPEWELLTWGEQYQGFFSLINQQRVMMYFALSFIVLVSAFSMMAVMFTVTIQKRREIGVMKALGAAPGQIVRVFLYQGMLLGLLGAILGVGLGRVVIYFRGPIQVSFRAFGFDPFSSSFTGFRELPAFNNPVEQLVIGIMAFILCSLAAFVPAFFAARSDAAKSLRNL